MKNLVKLLYLSLNLRPNCLLTRKPIWILTRSNLNSGTESGAAALHPAPPDMGGESTVQSSENDPALAPNFVLKFRFRLMKWQIERHGYKIDPRSNWEPLTDWEHATDAHEVDYCNLSVFAVLDYLILLAEEDYLEVK